MPHNPLRDVRLNDNQRRHYEVLFARFERSLLHIERAARGEEPRTALSVVEADLPDGFEREAAPVIAELRRQLSDLVASLALQPRVSSSRRTCSALVTSELIGLEDGYSSHLRGYGDVDPSLAEHLDPALRRLHASLADLGDLLRSARTPSEHERESKTRKVSGPRQGSE